MFNHVKYIQQFVKQNQDIPKENVYRFTGYPKWKLIGLHKLTPDENRGKHNLFIECIKNGVRYRPAIEWGWEGQVIPTRPVILDKPNNEPSGNIVIWSNQTIWAKVFNEPSDTVVNIHTRHPDEGPGNTLGHHSFFAVWEWQESTVPEPEKPLPNLADDIIRKIHELVHSYEEQTIDIK